MAREARKAGRYSDESEGGGLIYRPEDRVRENAWLGVGVYASLLVWYGWVVQQGVVWWVPVSFPPCPQRLHVHCRLVIDSKPHFR